MTDPDQLAQQVADHLYKPDTAATRLGIRLDKVTHEYAKLSVDIKSDMLNGHGICHGGVVFTLADACFAYAANSCNIMTVSQSSNITYTAQAFEHDTLTAEASVKGKSGGRTGLYDITVSNQRGEEIAFIRCNSYRLNRKVMEDLESL